MGPSMGHPSQTPQETSKPEESEQTVQPGLSPFTSELLALDEELTEVLDYKDVEENDPGIPDPEIARTVAHIPQADAFADVEMQESQPPLGFEPEVSRSGYDVNLVRSNPTESGLTSPVTVMENKMLDGVTSRTPGAGWLGYQGRPLPYREQLTFWGLIPWKKPLSIHEDGLLPGVGLKTEVPKMGYEKIQYINQICLWGLTRF